MVNGKTLSVHRVEVRDIASDFIERMDDRILYVIGSGSKIAGILAAIGFDLTLMGVDPLQVGTLVGRDLTEVDLVHGLSTGRSTRIIVTAIISQRRILSGHQQISTAALWLAGSQNLEIIASKSKLYGFERRPLLVDTSDLEFDDALRGQRPVATGDEDRVLYRVA